MDTGGGVDVSSNGSPSCTDAEDVAARIGYPVLVRPSYVLGGRAMEVVYNDEHLARYIRNATTLTPEHPVLVDKYLLGKEVEVDAICDGREVLIPGIMEHIERAGVHSGDSFAVYPGIKLYPAEIETLVEYTTRIALEINALGLINIQYVIHGGRIYVLEVNPRSSRTVPFLSKVTGVPMVNWPRMSCWVNRWPIKVTRAGSGRNSRWWRSRPPSSRWPSSMESKSTWVQK